MKNLLERPYARLVLMWALLHFILLKITQGVLYVLIYIPPKAFNLDSLIIGVHWVVQFLQAPRFLLRGLWPFEATSWIINFLTFIGNSLLWGFVIASLPALAVRLQGKRKKRPNSL